MVVIKINMKGVFEEWFSDLDASASLKACETGIYFNAQHKTLSFDVWNSCAMQCGTTELSLEVCKFEKTDWNPVRTSKPLILNTFLWIAAYFEMISARDWHEEFFFFYKWNIHM